VARKRARLGAAAVAPDKVLGALPVVARFCERLDIAGIINRACPIRDVAILSHGRVIETLIANRLTSPRPLVHVEDWAAQWAVEEVFGVEPSWLNDDRIGRALDAVAPVLDGVVGSIGVLAIAEFGLDVARLHWDMTSISLHGDYEAVDEEFAQPSYGHPKDRRPDLKQIQTGLAVTGDGGVPILHRGFDGKAGEVNQVVGAMESLRKMCGERSFLLVGDSKLVSFDNLRQMMAAGVTFIAPASKTYIGADVLAGCDFNAATPVDYVAERDGNREPADRGSYRVLEDHWTMEPPKKAKHGGLDLRRVFVWSSANAGAAAKARAKKLDRARHDLDGLTRGLGGRHYQTREKVQARLSTIASKRRVGDYLRSEVGLDATGKLTLAWRFDQVALDAEAATDGWYCLLTNLDASTADAGEVLTRYKGQEVVERRYGNFKGPLAVAPVFLKSNRRIEALLSVICLALLIFSLVEREARRAIAPELKIAGLGGYRDARPTGRNLLDTLARLHLIPATANAPPIVPAPTGLQARILELLDVDPLATR